MFASFTLVTALVIVYILVGLGVLIFYFQSVARYFMLKNAGVFDECGRLLYRRVLMRLILKTLGCLLLIGPLAFAPLSFLVLSPLYGTFALILYPLSKEWKALRYSTEILWIVVGCAVILHVAMGMAVRVVVA